MCPVLANELQRNRCTVNTIWCLAMPKGFMLKLCNKNRMHENEISMHENETSMHRYDLFMCENEKKFALKVCHG